MTKSIALACGLALALVAYFAFSAAFRPGAEPDRPLTIASPALVSGRPEVMVRETRRQRHTLRLSLRGRTEAEREVTIRSATTGVVDAAPAREGALVGAGTLLCRITVGPRQAQLREAEATVAARELDYIAAKDLAEKGWAPPTRAASARAELDAAIAARDFAAIELERIRIRAPFAGVFERRLAEAGDYLSPGGACGVLVDLDPLIVSADVAEEQASLLAVGAPAKVRLSNGEALAGEVRFVARTADERTRTFRIETEVPNPDGRLSAGLTADISFDIGETEATLISPALITLHDDGRSGVRYIDADGRVAFTEVEVVDDDERGVWVTGLANGARILAEGQDFVREGVQVEPVFAEEAG